MNRQKIIFLLILSFFTICSLSGISFHGLNLSNDDRLLFKTEFESQHALFISTLTDLTIQQLTSYPEKLQLVENGKTIIAVNKLGAVRIPAAGGLPSPLPGYPSFAQGDIPLGGRTQELSVSPDGKWILYIEPVSPAFGNLLLIDISSGIKYVLSEKVELPCSEFPAKWSPDSRLFVYSKDSKLYYFPIVSDLSVLVDERFRLIGPGTVNSVLWGRQGDFYYLLGNTLYCVKNPGLFTRTIYRDFLSIGSITAVLPLDFDSNFDRYWIAGDSTSILINKKGKSFFIFSLGENQERASVLPHVEIPYGAKDFNVLWSPSGKVVVFSSLQDKNITWHFEINGNSIENLTPSMTGFPSAADGALSPDGTKAVFWGENGLELWDFTNWRFIQKLKNEPVFSCAWVNNNLLISGSGSFIEEINISSAAYRLICLSGVNEFGFEAASRGLPRILAKVESGWYATDGKSPWEAVSNPQLRQVSLSSGRYRVFLEPQYTGQFENIPLIRSTNSTGTVSLVSKHSANSAFTTGQKTKIALCFDLYDDDAGVSQVLAALRQRNIRATFFLNGDFIRRNPVEAAAVIQAGHETASLFYAPIDFSDSRYRITQEFIALGLSRNEAEFHRVTARELSPLWHPPFYRISPMIAAAAASQGYTTIERTIDPRDWLSMEEAVRLNINQISASQMIENIMAEKTPGAVIPIRLGILPGGRDDYLFMRIEVLLDALIRSGVEIVPVSQVINR